MPHPIVNIADLDYFDWARGERFAARIGMIAPKLGAQKLGYNASKASRSAPRPDGREARDSFAGPREAPPALHRK